MAKKPNRRSIPVTITIERELLTTIDTLADAQNMTRSQFIERQVKNGIEQEKATVALLSNPAMATTLNKLFGSPEMLQTMASSLKEKVTEEHLEAFNRQFNLAAEEARNVMDSKKKGKGKKS